MFPKSKRISRKMFPRLLEGAKVFKNNLFLLRVVSINEKGARFSFSVSKKVSKSAVVRNRLRRSGYRLLSPYLPQIRSNVLVNFSFKEVPSDDQMIIKNLEALLKESKLIK